MGPGTVYCLYPPLDGAAQPPVCYIRTTMPYSPYTSHCSVRFPLQNLPLSIGIPPHQKKIILGTTRLTTQMASWSSLPSFHNTLDRQTKRLTDQQKSSLHLHQYLRRCVSYMQLQLIIMPTTNDGWWFPLAQFSLNRTCSEPNLLY